MSIKGFMSRPIVCFRYVVLISGKKAIHEALVVKSVDFADRPNLYTPSMINPNAKGLLLKQFHNVTIVTMYRDSQNTYM